MTMQQLKTTNCCVARFYFCKLYSHLCVCVFFFLPLHFCFVICNNLQYHCRLCRLSCLATNNNNFPSVNLEKKETTKKAITKKIHIQSICENQMQIDLQRIVISKITLRNKRNVLYVRVTIHVSI